MAVANEHVSDVALRDGSIVRVRPVEQQDRPQILDFIRSLSKEALRLRFLGGLSEPESLSKWLEATKDRFALVGVHEGRVVGHAAYQLISPGKAEWSVVVRDDMQGKGIGTHLLGQIIEAAGEAGIYSLEADLYTDNYKVLDVIHGLGFPSKHRVEGSTLHISHPTSISQEVIERFDRMEAVTSSAAVERFLRPKSVAIVGASRTRGTIGWELFHNALTGGFSGPVYAVNPSATVIQSVPAYKSVLEIPGPVDLVLITVRAEAVLDAARECGKKGVKAIVVISAGFAETGGKGTALQEELVEICREHGMRLIGPNCMGIMNTSAEVSLNAQFCPFPPIRGGLGILSQSGAVGIALIEYASRLGLGISSFVSVGNKVDISGNDLLDYWEGDKETKIALLYLESFGNPKKFSRIARRFTRVKPIVAVKGGRSRAGFKATQSHTGALVASSLVTVDALFKQAGVIRTNTLEEMFDVSALLSSQPVPKGRRVAIISNAGGAAILAADATEDHGLEVPELSVATKSKLRAFLNPDASVGNPVDMVASASPENYEHAIRAVSEDENVDAVVVIFIPPLELEPKVIAASVVKAVGRLERKVPVASVFMASKDLPPLLTGEGITLPNYRFPEAAVQAIAKAAEYGAWLGVPPEQKAVLEGVKKGEAVNIVTAAVGAGRDWLRPEEVSGVLRAYGIRTLEQTEVKDADGAVKAREAFGGKVAMKAVAPGLVHKSDVGGVALGLEDEAQVRDAARHMTDRLRAKGYDLSGFLVQPMLEDASEMFVGVTHDRIFGPIVACGAGGVFVELLKDVSVRLTPISKREAGEMVHSLHTYPALDGYRGAPRRDIAALEDVVVRVGALADEMHEILEVDLNPLMVLTQGKGACVVDARIRVGPAPPELPLGAKKK